MNTIETQIQYWKSIRRKLYRVKETPQNKQRRKERIDSANRHIFELLKLQNNA